MKDLLASSPNHRSTSPWNTPNLRNRLGLILISCSLITLTTKAQIILSASGGTGGDPLTIQITTGGTFEITQSMGGGAFVVFDNFWDNTAKSIAEDASFTSMSLGGFTAMNSTGASTGFDIDQTDLILGFEITSLLVGNSATLTPGQRTTSGLNLDYTTINPSGTAFIRGVSIGDSSSNLTWATVPEPQSYAAAFSLICGTIAVYRKRLRTDNRQASSNQ